MVPQDRKFDHSMVPQDRKFDHRGYATPVFHQNFESMTQNYHDTEGTVYLNTSLRLKSRSMSSDSDEDGRSKRFRLSPESNSEGGEMNNVDESNPLGLILKKTPSFLNLIESELSEGSKKKGTSSSPPRQLGRPASSTRKYQMNSSSLQGNASRNKSRMDDFETISEKLKASNFPAMYLRIGEWERISRYEGDLIAKCYYAKRKLVWEILDGPLKSKIEIQWSDIIAIRAFIPQDDQPGFLEIELNQPPSFYRETNPQPRKHTLWQQTSDFTGGQAPTYRRHYVRFPPGVLDKHYEKLLHCDARLNELSKQPFPRHLSPYFESDVIEFSDFELNSGYGSQFFAMLPYRPRTSSSVLLPNHPMHNKSTMMAPIRHSRPSFPVSGVRGSNYANTTQRRPLLCRGPNDLVNVAIRNQSLGMLPVSTTQHANWVILNQNDQAMYHENDSMGRSPNNVMLNCIENHLLNDNQVACSSEPKSVANVDSMYSLLECSESGSLNATSNAHNSSFGYQVMDNYASNVLPYNGLTYPEAITWMAPQVTTENLMLDHSASPSAYSDAVYKGYPTLDSNQP